MMRRAACSFLLAMLLIPLTALSQPIVDGNLSDADYRVLATKENANAGFGPNIDVQRIVFYVDQTSQVLYLGVVGQLDTGSDNGIGLWLDFGSPSGAAAGTSLGFGGGGHYFDGDNGGRLEYAADFEVDYGLALNPGGTATNVFVDGASYVGGPPSGGFVGTIDQSGTAATNQGLLTAGSVTHAFNNGGGTNQGYEIALPFSELGITSAAGFSAFTFVVSSTGYFSDVMVPGDATNGNPGFDADFEANVQDPNGFGANPGSPIGIGPFHASAPESLPGIAEPVAPTGGAERSILNLGGLDWMTAGGAVSYQVEVYAAEAFPNGDPFFTPTTSETNQPLIRRAPGDYVWRVRGINALGAGPWSAPASFRIAVDIPGLPRLVTPSLIAPPNGSTGLTPTVQLEWQDVGATGYQVEVATTEDFAEGTVVATARTEASVYVLSGLDSGQTYYWRVQSTGAGGPSAFSAPWSFTVGEGGPAPLTFDGQMNEDAWGAPLDTNEGGPEPGFGPDQRINALYAFGDEQYLYVGVSGRVTTDDVASNRVLVFIDSEDGGYNRADFGRANTLAGGIQNFNSETTFDPGFAPDHVLSIGHDGATTYFFDLYTLSGSVNTTDSGGPNLFLGSTAGDAGGTDPDGLAAMPTSDGANRTDGYEVRLPRNVLGLSDDAPVQLFAIYTSDTGFLSNQFISPAGPDADNFGDGPVAFGQATPDPVTVAADQLDGSAASDKVTDTRPAPETPGILALHGNYPNPFNPTTTIRFDLPEAATVRVEVLDVRGRRVLSVPSRPLSAGADHRLTLDAGHLPSGLYLYRVVAEGTSATHQRTGRMMLIK